MSPTNPRPPPKQAPSASGDDEEDPWDTRIKNTGCAAENEKLNDCFFRTKDWRKCQDEMKAFKECWAQKGNASRTAAEEKK